MYSTVFFVAIDSKLFGIAVINLLLDKHGCFIVLGSQPKVTTQSSSINKSLYNFTHSSKIQAIPTLLGKHERCAKPKQLRP